MIVITFVSIVIALIWVGIVLMVFEIGETVGKDLASDLNY